jgi:DNA polymerase III subunit beta
LEIQVEQSELSKGLSKYQALVSRKSTMPILSFCLIQADQNCIYLLGSDLEVSVKLKIPAKVISSGTIGIMSKTFFELVRELNSGLITIRLENVNKVRLTHGRSRFNLVGVDAKDFPVLPGLENEAPFTIEADTFLEMINMTLYAVSNDENRYNLSGVCLESPNSDQLRLVATDGHRLALVNRDYSSPVGFNQLIIPKRGLAESRKIIEEYKGSKINFGVASDGFFIISTKLQQVAIRLIDEEFPAYSEVIPVSQGVKIHVNCSQFLHSLRRVSLIIEENRPVRFEIAENTLTMLVDSPNLGDAREEIGIEYNSEQIIIGFNARYLVEVCNAFGEDCELTMEILSGMEPTKFYRSDDPSALAVVMPIRLEMLDNITTDSGY